MKSLCASFQRRLFALLVLNAKFLLSRFLPKNILPIELFSYSLSVQDLIILTSVAVMLGMAKVGIAGTGMIAVPLMALAFGGKESTGLLLTILIFADVMGVLYFHQHASWHHLRRLLPFAMIGIVVGTVTGNHIDDLMFRFLMAIIIFASLPLMIWQQREQAQQVPDAKWFVYSVGILGGFTTMVGNLAGPVMAMYLLSMRFPKNQFIGTAAWFFFIINLAKVPFHVVAWGTITWNSVMLTAVFIPAVILGAWIGLKIINLINEYVFRWLVIIMTAVAALAMVL